MMSDENLNSLKNFTKNNIVLPSFEEDGNSAFNVSFEDQFFFGEEPHSIRYEDHISQFSFSHEIRRFQKEIKRFKSSRRFIVVSFDPIVDEIRCRIYSNLQELFHHIDTIQSQYLKLKKTNQHTPSDYFFKEDELFPIWVDIQDPNEDDIQNVGKYFQLHNLTIEDLLEEDSGEKWECFPSYLYVCFSTLHKHLNDQFQFIQKIYQNRFSQQSPKQSPKMQQEETKVGGDDNDDDDKEEKEEKEEVNWFERIFGVPKYSNLFIGDKEDIVWVNVLLKQNIAITIHEEPIQEFFMVLNRMDTEFTSLKFLRDQSLDSTTTKTTKTTTSSKDDKYNPERLKLKFSYITTPKSLPPQNTNKKEMEKEKTKNNQPSKSVFVTKKEKLYRSHSVAEFKNHLNDHDVDNGTKRHPHRKYRPREHSRKNRIRKGEGGSEEQQQEEEEAFEEDSEEGEERGGSITPCWILYALFDATTDLLLPRIDENLRRNELGYDRILEYDSGLSEEDEYNFLRFIQKRRKEVDFLRRTISVKNRLVTNFMNGEGKVSQYIAPETRIYFRDVKDHISESITRLVDSKEALDHSHTNYLIKLSLEHCAYHKQNTSFMNKVAIFETIMMPLEVISMAWGMNMPVPGDCRYPINSVIWFYGVLMGMMILSILSFFVFIPMFAKVETLIRYYNLFLRIFCFKWYVDWKERQKKEKQSFL